MSKFLEKFPEGTRVLVRDRELSIPTAGTVNAHRASAEIFDMVAVHLDTADTVIDRRDAMYYDDWLVLPGSLELLDD